jgi:osmotically-inducible protein OsmY
VEQEGAELVAEPQRAAAVDAERLDVEVAAGEIALRGGVVDELERDLVIRVPQADRTEDTRVVALGLDR